MTIRICVQHVEPDAENSVFVSTSTSDGVVVDTTLIGPGQEFEYIYVSENQKVLVEEVVTPEVCTPSSEMLN